MWTIARVTAAAAAVAIAVYSFPAAIQIVAWPADGPVRLAFVPPASRLFWTAAAVVLSTLAVIRIVARRRAPADSARPSAAASAVERVAEAATPLTLLGLWAVPYLPWLPDRAPLLLLLAGPLRWAVAAVAIAGAFVTTIRPSIRTFAPPRAAVFAVSFIVYVAFGLQFASEVGFGGDEPHYLVIAHSLYADHDLDIANNHAQRDYRAFFPGDLRPDYLRRGTHGEIYSIHAPGLPALLVPAYAAGGATGAVVVMALLGALTALAIFDLAAHIGGSGVATIVWLSIALTVPLIPHAWLIYPETPAALVVAWSLLLVRRGLTMRSAVAGGLALAFLPWLHTKLVVLTAAFALWLAWRTWPKVKVIAALAAPIAISGAAWLFAFYRMYGVLDPEAPYGSSTATQVLLENVPRGVLGLLVDQKFGLLAYSPVYLLASVGLWLMLRDRASRPFAAGIALTTMAFVGSTTRFYMWWGGSSAPARFLVPVVPLLAACVAYAVSRWKTVAARAVVVSTIAISLAVTAAAVTSPRERLLYNEPHGVSELALSVEGSAPLDASLPTFTEPNWIPPLLALLPVTLGALAACAVMVVTVRRSRSAFFPASAAAVAGFVVFAIVARVRAPGDRAGAVIRGQLAMLDAYDPSRLRAVDYSRLRRASDTDVLAALTLSIRRPPPAADERSPGGEGPFRLPEGRYDARYWFDRPGGEEVAAMLSRSVAAARAKNGDTNPATLPVELVLTAPVWFGTSAGSGTLRRVDVAPAVLVPRSHRAGLSVRAVDPIEGAPQGSHAFIAYTDASSYPEGGVFWTDGTRASTVAIVPDGARALVLVVHIGPTGGRVRIAVAGESAVLDLKGDETREHRVSIAPGTRWLAVTVQSDRAFRPAELDRASDDRRLLGCQVRPRLE